MSEILAFGGRRTNDELVRDCALLGYLAADRRTLDPTYGLGRFWKLWRPHNLVASDLDPNVSPIGYSVDARKMPFDGRMTYLCPRCDCTRYGPAPCWCCGTTDNNDTPAVVTLLDYVPNDDPPRGGVWAAYRLAEPGDVA